MRLWYDQIAELTKKELRARYKTYVFGYLWSIANPLVLAFIFYFALKLVMKIQVEDYPIFLISALFAWQWFANSVGVSSTVFIGNVSLVKKINFPREFIPLSTVLNDTFHFIMAFPVIVLFVAIFDKPITAAYLLLPLIALAQFMIIYGAALFVSTINLFFRDMERLVNVLLTIMFYVTPVLYPHDRLPEEAQFLLYVNPMSPVIVLYRRVILEGSFDFTMLSLAFLHGSLALLIGYSIYNKLKWKFAEII